MSYNLEAVRKAVTDAGLDPATAGRYDLGRVLGISEWKARELAAQLKGKAKAKVETPPLDPIEEHKLQKENRELRRQLKETLEKQVVNQRYQDFIAEIAAKPICQPAWLTKQPSYKKHTVTPTAFLSDTHFGEVVSAPEVNWANKYDVSIAELRLRNFFHNTIKFAHKYLHGMDYTGIVLALGGDLFSGNIHDELKETNEQTIGEAILHWLGPMEAGIKLLADAFGKVYLPCVVGNHPRNTQKPRHKMRVRDNFDWLFYRLLERNITGDKRVTFDVSESSDFYYQVFGTRYCLTHGDQFRGGSGISGILTPVTLGDSRKRKRSQSIQLPYDYLLMGHWHQLLWLKKAIVNGSMKGFDEFALDNNYDYEPPQQAFWITDPQHAVTLHAPIFVEDDAEGWRKPVPHVATV
jgi:hypothetical protein